ncbi:hypothetical protein ANN_23804 [Periplaneta americana]|uniref:Uncharacterized protein n=1 Tax=Periplaneta americana TaxID=6978 RepID=A0ABQ8SN69_PERAM|nr:hypothetical protein ANN_23804 [Periplaneta americana]
MAGLCEGGNEPPGSLKANNTVGYLTTANLNSFGALTELAHPPTDQWNSGRLGQTSLSSSPSPSLAAVVAAASATAAASGIDLTLSWRQTGIGGFEHNSPGKG